MPTLVKSADAPGGITHPGETVIYSFEFTNDDPSLSANLVKIEDSYFGIIWSGSEIVLPGQSTTKTYSRVSDCTTITNFGTAYYYFESE